MLHQALFVGHVNITESLFFTANINRVRNLKFTRNLKFATSKILVNSRNKMVFCLKFGIFLV